MTDDELSTVLQQHSNALQYLTSVTRTLDTDRAEIKNVFIGYEARFSQLYALTNSILQSYNQLSSRLTELDAKLNRAGGQLTGPLTTSRLSLSDQVVPDSDWSIYSHTRKIHFSSTTAPSVVSLADDLLQVNTKVDANGPLNVNGPTTLGGTLAVTGAATLNATTIRGGLGVNSLIVDGQTFLKNNVILVDRNNPNSADTWTLFTQGGIFYLGYPANPLFVTVFNDHLTVKGRVVATNISESSDRRLKTDIEPLTSSLARLLELRGVSYRWTDPSYGQGRQLGLIAQEVEAVFPELVGQHEEEHKTLNYSGLIAPLVEAVREQQQQITDLRRELAELRERLA